MDKTDLSSSLCVSTPYVRPLQAAVWKGGDRSAELTTLYVERYVGPRSGTRFTAHHHWEVTYVFRGRGRLEVEPGQDKLARAVHLRPGTCALVPPRIRHREIGTPDTDTLWLGVAGSVLDTVRADNGCVDVVANELSGIGQQLWLRSRSADGTGEPFGPELDALARLIIATVQRITCRSRDKDPIGEVLRQMHERYADRLPVNTLAARAGFSEAHFHRTFRARTGLTPHAYVTQLRVRQAVLLLRESTMPIGAVARMVGYEDPLHFSRLFARAMGQSPSSFRASGENRIVTETREPSIELVPALPAKLRTRGNGRVMT